MRHPLVIASGLLYAALCISRRQLHLTPPPLVAFYLADLLFMPLLLSFALAGQQVVYGRDHLPATWLLGAWAGASLWFEVLLPRWSARAVADPFDVLAYALGTLAFHRWLNQPPADVLGGKPAERP